MIKNFEATFFCEKTIAIRENDPEPRRCGTQMRTPKGGQEDSYELTCPRCETRYGVGVVEKTEFVDTCTFEFPDGPAREQEPDGPKAKSRRRKS